MAFLKGLTAEDMEVRVVDPDQIPELRVKEWEREFAKHLQSEVRIERFYNDN